MKKYLVSEVHDVLVLIRRMKKVMNIGDDNNKNLSPVGFWVVAPSRRDRLGIVDATGEKLTFGEMYDRINQVSHLFRRKGMRVGDTIAVVARNRVDTMVVHLAAMQSGLYYTPINYHSVGPEIEYIFRDSETSLVICDQDFVSVVREVSDAVKIPLARRIVLGRADGFESLREMIIGESTSLPPDRIGGQILQYTSGTTGRPKGVRRKIANVDADTAAASLSWVLEMYGIDASKPGVMLTTTPIYHTAGLNLTTLALHFGVSIVLMDRWTPEHMLELIEQFKVNMTVVVPTQFVRLLKLEEIERNSRDVSSLEWVLHGAAPCSPEIKRQMIEWWGPIIYEYYGSTEVGGTFVTSDDWLSHPGTVGKPGPVTKLQILNDSDMEMPTGAVGRIFMRQGDDQIEYLHDPEKTSKSRVRDMMTVGDIGWVDSDGYLYLAGRTSEVIIVGGTNIYPAEVENVILGHVSVADVCVVGIPSEEYGEEVFAAIVLRGSDQDASETIKNRVRDEIGKICFENLAKFKCPRKIEFRHELPRDPNGKLYRKKVRDPFWESVQGTL